MNRTILVLVLTVAFAGVTLAADESNPPPPVAAAPASNVVASAIEPTVVTSERLHVDYAHNVGTFEVNVLAVDPRITVRADKMTVFFASSSASNKTAIAGAPKPAGGADSDLGRSVDKIIAEGAVVITTPENKRSNSDRAEYTAADGKVILTGHPIVQSPDGTVSGTRITFWRGSEKMDVESDQTDTNRTKLIIYPEEQRKQNKDGQ
jgi:lipopolysaccharide export system protein LptA